VWFGGIRILHCTSEFSLNEDTGDDDADDDDDDPYNTPNLDDGSQS